MKPFISSWSSLDVFIVAVAWQSAIELRWHVVLLITANDTLTPPSHKCSHHMQSTLTFAPPPTPPWCAHSPICFTQYVLPASLWRHPPPNPTTLSVVLRLTFRNSYPVSCFLISWSVRGWFGSKCTDVLLKWKYPCRSLNSDSWTHWTIYVQASCHVFVRLPGTRVRSHHGGFSVIKTCFEHFTIISQVPFINHCR